MTARLFWAWRFAGPVPTLLRACRRKLLLTERKPGDFPLADSQFQLQFHGMVIIRFSGVENERRGVAALLGRFSGKTWANGDWLLPLAALPHLAGEGIEFEVKGRPDYMGQHAPIRDSAPAPV